MRRHGTSGPRPPNARAPRPASPAPRAPGQPWSEWHPSGYPDEVTADTRAPGQTGASTPSIPLNPGRRDLGMRATMIFPNREIVERYYVPLIYTACRTCYSELAPDDIF